MSRKVTSGGYLQENPKRTEWGLLRATTILNTTWVHSNLVKQCWYNQCWYNQRMIAFRYLETLIEAFRRSAKKGKELYSSDT